MIAIVTYNLVDHFQDGDIIAYRITYEFFALDKEDKNAIFSVDSNTDLWGNQNNSTADYYSKHLTSKEKTHFYIISIFSKFIDYKLFLSLLNFAFVFLIILNLEKLKTNIYVTIFLIFTNYYLIVLYFSAERLKVGFIFVLLAFYFIDRKFAKFPLIFLALISHFQLILFYISIYLINLLNFFFQIIFEYRIKFFYAVLAIFLLPIPFLSFQHISYKLAQINIDYLLILSGFVKLSIFLFLTIFHSKKITKILLLFLPLFIGNYFLGSSRLIIFAFIFYLYFALQDKNGINFSIIVISLYYFFKSLSLIFILTYCHSFNLTNSGCDVYLQSIHKENFQDKFIYDPKANKDNDNLLKRFQ